MTPFVPAFIPASTPAGEGYCVVGVSPSVTLGRLSVGIAYLILTIYIILEYILFVLSIEYRKFFC